MKQQELSRAFRLFAEGFNALANAYEPVQGENVPTENRGAIAPTMTSTRPVEAKKEEKVAEVKKEVKKEVAPVETKKPVEAPKEEVNEDLTQTPTKEELEALSYNDIKAMAKEVGVKAVGSKASIIKNILDSFEQPTAVEEVAPKEEPTPEEETLEIEEDEVEGEEETNEDTTFYDKVVNDLVDYTDEELADILSEIGISPKGKRQALLSKIVQAIEDEKLEWDSSEEETTEDTPQENPKAETETDEGEEEYDFVTEARKETCLEIDSQARKDFKAKKLTPKDLINALKEFDSEYVSEGKENDLENYILLKMNLVDEDGTQHDLQEAYYIGDDVYCCGVQLQDLDGDYFCEVCGQKYEK